MKTYYVKTKKQLHLERMPGDHKFKPQYITQDESGNIMWKKWGGAKPINVNYFRLWINDASGDSILVNVRDMYQQNKGFEQDIITYNHTITQRLFRFPRSVFVSNCNVS